MSSIRFRALAVLALAAIALVVAFVVYPRTTLVIGVQHSALDAQGQPRAQTPLRAIVQSLQENGITPRIAQQEGLDEKPSMQWLIENPQLDLVLASNTGAELPPAVLADYASHGVVTSTPLFFFMRAGGAPIRSMRDLKGKRIILWSSPEGTARPGFSPGSAAPSPYSTDFVLTRLFAHVGIDARNTVLTNAWPAPITLAQDWDVWLSVGLPLKESRSQKLWDDIAQGRVQMIRFDDLEGVSRGLAELKRGVLHASSLMADAAVPSADIPYLAFSRSAVARKDLDSSLALALAQALKKAYSPQGVLNDKDAFPTFRQPETFKPNAVADDFYRNGSPFLSQYLSHTIAAFVFKLIVILVPVLAILAPLTGPLPKAYEFYVTNKATEWSGELEHIEREYPAAGEEQREHFRKRLADIQARLQALRLPIFHRYFAQQVLSARGNVESLKNRLEKIPPAQPTRSDL